MRHERLKRLERATPRIAQGKSTIDATALSDAALSALMAVIDDPERDKKARDILSAEGATKCEK